MKSERISPFWVNGYQPFSAGKILISGKNLIFKPEGDNYLVLESNWASLVMKYKGIVDDYKLWNYVLSDFE